VAPSTSSLFWWLVLLSWAEVSFEMENRVRARELIRCKIRLPLPLWSDIKNWLAAEACPARVRCKSTGQLCSATVPTCGSAKVCNNWAVEMAAGMYPGTLLRVDCGGGREPMEPARTRELRAARPPPLGIFLVLPSDFSGFCWSNPSSSSFSRVPNESSPLR